MTTSTPAPNGCDRCGVEKRGHMTRWAMGVGMHQFAAPQDWQRKQRMQDRRARELGITPDTERTEQ